MIKVGARIYYDNQTGNVIFEIPEQIHYGDRIEQTVERDIETINILSERNRETFDVLELSFGEYRQDFDECTGYRVNPVTKSLEFSYPDPNQPDADPVYIPPLSESVNAQTEYLVDVDFRLSMVELGL